jgi:hypothetical protein
MGGDGPGPTAGNVRHVAANVEVYDPAIGAFSFVGNLDCPDYRWTFTPLKNGTVLIIDGTSAEIYDPATSSK